MITDGPNELRGKYTSTSQLSSRVEELIGKEKTLCRELLKQRDVEIDKTLSEAERICRQLVHEEVRRLIA